VNSGRVYVVDTNALLNDPEVLYFFSGSEVVVPAAVLKELDHLKRRGKDRRIRYHGRKATRLLFEASQQGRLVDGVPLGNGSILRVESEGDFEDAPVDLDLERTDDLILAHAWAINRRPLVRATLVTNDLNMLLRAEAMGIEAYRFEGKLDRLHKQERGLLERARERRWTLIFAFLALLFLSSTAYLYVTRPAQVNVATLPQVDDASLLQSLGIAPSILEDYYSGRIREDEEDLAAHINLGNLLFDQGEFLEAVEHYRTALQLEPENTNVLTDTGIALMELGHYREAVVTLRRAVGLAPSDSLINYNLGVAYALGGNGQEAIRSLDRAVRLAEEQQFARFSLEEAKRLIEDLRTGNSNAFPRDS